MARPRPVKRLEVCPKCAGYMRPHSSLTAQAVNRHWKDETRHRSFGGVELKKFVCEKCQHEEIFQVDDLGHIGEDD